MYKYITFKSGGSFDIPDLKDSIIVIKNDELEYGYRLASKLNSTIYPRVKELKDNKAVREVFSGYMEEHIKLKAGDIISINEVNEFDYVIDPMTFNILRPVRVIEKNEEDKLSNAKVCFLVGRGIGNKENYLRLKKIADKLNIPIGCSRPVCMNGWESYDNFVGISGKSLNCDLVITFGVSGSGPLMKGLENVKKIISINNDPNALIFNYSDYGVIEDINKVIKRLESEYK